MGRRGRGRQRAAEPAGESGELPMLRGSGEKEWWRCGFGIFPLFPPPYPFFSCVCLFQLL